MSVPIRGAPWRADDDRRERDVLDTGADRLEQRDLAVTVLPLALPTTTEDNSLTRSAKWPRAPHRRRPLR
jgi:hypothetical protein